MLAFLREAAAALGCRPEPADDELPQTRASRSRTAAAGDPGAAAGAGIACLAELGYAASTVAVVAERAGVSRGAAQHHFPTREALFTAALEHVTRERGASSCARGRRAAAAERSTPRRSSS